MEKFELENARSWIQTAALLIAENAAMLSDLDSAIGDGDHGENMMRGFKAIGKKLEDSPPSDLPALFKLVGMTLLSSVGGAAGPLYGGFFLALGKASAGKDTLTSQEVGNILEEGLTDIRKRGKAQAGDKTMVDALAPALQSFREQSDAGLSAASLAAAEQADQSAKATIPMLARKGRASYLAERSIGHQDPGATSVALLLHALATACQNGS